MTDEIDKEKEKEKEDKDVALPQNPVVESLPPEVEKFLDKSKAPPAVRRSITEMASFMMGPSVHPLFNKFSDSHIDKFLDYTHDENKNDYKLESSGRIFNLIYFIGAILFLSFLVWFLAKDSPNVLSEILKILAIFGGGFGAGFGFKTYLDKNK